MTTFRGVAENRGGSASPSWLPEKIAELLAVRFFDEQQCAGWFLRRYYPAGPVCPRCGGAITDEHTAERWAQLKRINCPHCRRQVKATHGTLLHEAQLSPRQLFVLLSLVGIGADLDTVARAAGVTTATVKAWRDKVIALAEAASE
jgi:transposase-like protein